MSASALVAGLAEKLDTAGVGDYNATGPMDPARIPIALGAMPPGKGAAIVLTTYPGGPEPDTRNGWEFPRLQVRVRHADLLQALDLERQVYEVLQAVPLRYPQQLTGWHLQDCYAIQSEAQPMGVDANGRHELSRNYQLTCWPT